MSPLRRILLAAGVGIALGLSIAWFADSLPYWLGTVVILTLLAAVMVWAFKQLAWARRMARELDDEGEQ